ncbi:MAG: zinc-binding dehydrogenase [Ilumatobacter sp.]
MTSPSTLTEIRAAVCREFGAPLQIETLTIDPPASDEVAVDIRAVAICASDLHANDGAWGGSLPVVNGHEAAGVVVAVGSDVDRVSTGDRVMVSLLRSCRSCFFCDRGETHLCETRSDFAIANEARLRDASGVDVAQGVYTGAFAERVVVHHSQVEQVPDAVSFEAAALLACGVATGFGAVANTVDVPPGASVVVIGAGGVGLNSIQGARVAGAAPIVAIDVSDAKLADAVEFGASDTIRGDEADVSAALGALTDGRGADFVVVTVGSTAAIEQAIDLARNGGTVVVVGMTRSGAHASIETSGFAGNAKKVVGSFLGSTDLRRDVPRLTDLYLQGELLLDELVSQRWSLDEINDAIASTRSGAARRNVIVIGADS